MKLPLIALFALTLTGCSTAGLNVSWWIGASYNTNVNTKTEAIHATSPVQPASAAK